GMPHENCEQIELARSELYRLVISRNSVTGQIECNVLERQDFRTAGFRRCCSAQERPHPGQELIEIERFHQVVVCASIESSNTVGHIVASCEHQDWETWSALGLFGGANALGDLK